MYYIKCTEVVAPNPQITLTHPLYDSNLQPNTPVNYDENVHGRSLVIFICTILIVTIFSVKSGIENPQQIEALVPEYTIRAITADAIPRLFKLMDPNVQVAVTFIIVISLLIVIGLYIKRNPEKAWDVIGERALSAFVFTVVSIALQIFYKKFIE